LIALTTRASNASTRSVGAEGPVTIELTAKP
jgi:hypothetical protein